MDSRMFSRLGGVLLAGGLVAGPTGLIAQQQGTLTNAQIESNVLRALANTPALSAQNVQSATVYGTVTLTGSVQTEALRTQAENLVARTTGVRKVVDELTLGSGTATAEVPGQTYQPAPDAAAMGQQPDSPQSNAPVLLSDGTYGPPPDGSGAQPQPSAQPNTYAQNGTEGYGNTGSGQPMPPPAVGTAGPAPRQPMYQNYEAAPIPGGQRAGINVTVPAGAMLRIRINRGLDSNHVHPGAIFDGTVLTDIVADGAVAIPRGAQVQGVVVDAKKAGVFKGEGELGLQINTVTLGGTVYPLSTQLWQREGRDKTAGTVNSAIGLGVLGAVLGGFAGGGAGAAVGAGVGGAAGVAGSAATPRGQIIIPPESVLSFTTANPSVVRTVSEAEMSRLAYAAGPRQPPPPPRPYPYGPYGYGPYGPPY